ncbi:serine/threonine protein kinase [Zavarzinella formosa]|uniref:serine/threonine protein kinase n=1 Tax=Zavarzinella formosa TaxID=360055 RepID=UPI00035D056A|nr:serine/threonine-protein kinase [Zavarzinella formosa]
MRAGTSRTGTDADLELDSQDVTSTAVLSSAETLPDIRLEVSLPPIGGYLGRCRLQAHMAAGSNSAVFLGELWDLRIPVAVKVLAPRDPSFRASLAVHLRNEFEVLCKLSHACIARLWDYRDDHEQPHLATEYVHSLTLDQLRIKHGGRVSVKLALRIALKIVDGLSSAWRLGFAHRDVKPENILFTPDGNVKIIDWGLAGEVGRELPSTLIAEPTRFIGTPAYMAPESARTNRAFDHRTDIYSLGATIYHLVTGKLAFEHVMATKMILAHLHEPLTPAFDHVQEPGMLRLSEVLSRMMAKNPNDRYQDPDELRDDLTRALSEDSGGNSKFIRIR